MMDYKDFEAPGYKYEDHEPSRLDLPGYVAGMLSIGKLPPGFGQAL